MIHVFVFNDRNELNFIYTSMLLYNHWTNQSLFYFPIFMCVSFCDRSRWSFECSAFIVTTNSSCVCQGQQATVDTGANQSCSTLRSSKSAGFQVCPSQVDSIAQHVATKTGVLWIGNTSKKCQRISAEKWVRNERFSINLIKFDTTELIGRQQPKQRTFYCKRRLWSWALTVGHWYGKFIVGRCREDYEKLASIRCRGNVV